MRRASLLLAAIFAAVTVFAGAAVAEPQKNQVPVSVSCDNGESYTFVLNGEGNSGHIEDSTNNVIAIRYTATYLDFETGEVIAVDTVDNGVKKGLEGELTQCEGRTVVEDWRLGKVISVFDLSAIVTPRGYK